MIQELQEAEQNDTRAALQIALTVAYESASLDSSYYFIKEALLSVEKTENILLRKEAEIMEARIYYLQGKMELADQALDGIMAEAKKGKLPQAFVSAVVQKINVLESKGNYEEGLVIGEEALQFIKKDPALIGEPAVRNNIGNCYRGLGKYQKSIEEFLVALELYKKQGNVYGEHMTDNNLAAVYYELGDLEKVKEYANNMLTICKEPEITSCLGKAYNLLGTVSLATGDLVTAEFEYEKSIHYSKAAGRNRDAFNTMNNLGAIYYYSKKYKKAQELGEAVLAEAKAKDDNQLFITAYSLLGSVHADLKEWEISFDYQQAGLDLSRQMKDKNFEWQFLLGFSQTHELKRESDKALQYYKQYKAVTDTIFQVEKTKAIEEMEQKYKNEQLKAKNVIQKEKLKQNKILLLFTSLVGILLGFLGWNLFRKNKALKKQKSKIEDQKDEIGNLFTYMNHMTKNQLTTLVSIINIQNRQLADDDKAKPVLLGNKGRLEAIKNLHQQLLYQEKGHDKIKLLPYLETLSNNILNSFGEEIKFSLDVPDIKLDVNTTATIGLLLNEMMTNSFKYAFEQSNAPPEIKLSIHHAEESLQLHYQDNGIGFPDEGVGHNNSFGSELIETFAANIGGQLKKYNKNGANYEMFISKTKI